MKQFMIGPKLFYGPDSLESLRKIMAEKIMVVTDPIMMKIGIVDQVINQLNKAGKSVVIFSEVEPDPSLETVEKGLALFLKEDPGCIVAVGGGSPIDAAKAILLFAVKARVKLQNAGCDKPTFVAIPTTSGTGSEVTSYAVVTDTKNSVKIPLSDPLMNPDIAILDEQLTKTVPKSVTADTGMDVLTHAVEAYVSLQSTDITDMYAEKAVVDVFHNLVKAYHFGDDLQARGKLHVASCIAGIAFTNAGLGINHSLAHAIGGRFHFPHGRTNAILLPYVIAYNSGLFDGTANTCKAAKKYAALARLIGCQSQETEVAVTYLISQIIELNKKLSIPSVLGDCQATEEEFCQAIPAMAQSAVHDICTTANPKPVTSESLERLLVLAFKGTL